MLAVKYFKAALHAAFFILQIFALTFFGQRKMRDKAVSG